MDAFAVSGSSGNPAGAVYPGEAQNPDEETMLRIGRELKGFVSEVGFVFPVDEGSVRLRLKYYSSECEVDFCGHATIAIMYDYFKSMGSGAPESICIETNRGILEVFNRIAESDAVFITAPSPEYRNEPISPAGAAGALGIETADLNASLPVSIINAGLNTLLVPVRSLETLLGLKPDFEVLKGWLSSSGADIVEVFCPETVSPLSAWRVRVFCPKFGYLEDPATGSGNSAFGNYLLKNGLWDGSSIALEQNGERERFNVVRLASGVGRGTHGEYLTQVLFGGGASVKIDGEYHI